VISEMGYAEDKECSDEVVIEEEGEWWCWEEVIEPCCAFTGEF